MPEGFVPLTAFLSAPGATLPPGPNAPPPSAAGPLTVASDDSADDGDDGVDGVQTATLRELTLMRLAAFEAFEHATTALLARFAADVLGRELALAPADVEALARTALASCGDEPVTIFLSPCDAERVRTSLPVRVDRSLAAGDLVVEVRDGALESSQSFRLTAALERAAPGLR